MEYQDPYVDVYGLNFKGLSKDESLSLFESFIKDKGSFKLYDESLQPYMTNDGDVGYIWSPCEAVEFHLTKEEVCRLYPQPKV